MSYFGKNIRKIRIVKKMSQTEFAELFELKRTALGSYEEGRAEAKIDTVIRIADYFHLTLDQLLRKELTINEIFHFREDLMA
jgi:transcriptional regulator with XRE-family HTH domain